MSSQIWEIETRLVQEAGGLVASLCSIAKSQYCCAQSLPTLGLSSSPTKTPVELPLIPQDPVRLPPPLSIPPSFSQIVCGFLLCVLPHSAQCNHSSITAAIMLCITNSWLVYLSLLDSELLEDRL